MPPGLSPVHILVVLTVALIVLGPEQLPAAIRRAGRFLGEMRRWSGTLRDEFDRAVTVEPDGEPARDPPEEES